MRTVKANRWIQALKILQHGWWCMVAMALLAVSPSPSTAAPATTPAIVLPLVARNFPDVEQWTQEAHDAQRTGATGIDPLLPWTFLWAWNGPDAGGGAANHLYDAPRQAYTVSGAGAIYVPAGTSGVYALAQSDGHVLWNARPAAASFNATPAFDPATGYVLAGSADGKLYRFNASTGDYATYATGSPINRGILLTGGYAYAVTDNARLYKVNINTLATTWVYTAPGSTTPGTGLAYSASRDIVLFATEDLYVQAVNNTTGLVKWRVKPSSNPAGFPNQWLWYWPVVAEQHGIVFLRMRLDHNTGLWGYPSNGHIWPNTNAEARTFLQANPGQQNLFALNLDSGSPQFIPAVGYGGVEDLVNGQAFLTTGPVPVIKAWPNGDEVAYTHFRNGQAISYPSNDGRQDSHIGEMVLDTTTIAGYAPGDLRFVQMACNMSCGFTAPNYRRSYAHVSDEQTPLTMAGNTLFHAHWGASESARITDRSDALGLSYGSPILTTSNPAVLRRVAPCGSALTPTSTHYIATCGLNAFGDGRYWPNPGFWTYWNTWDPPTTSAAASAYSDGMRPRYTYVTGNLIVVEGNGGELMVFRHSGAVTP